MLHNNVGVWPLPAQQFGRPAIWRSLNRQACGVPASVVLSTKLISPKPRESRQSLDLYQEIVNCEPLLSSEHLLFFEKYMVNPHTTKPPLHRPIIDKRVRSHRTPLIMVICLGMFLQASDGECFFKVEE